MQARDGVFALHDSMDSQGTELNYREDSVLSCSHRIAAAYGLIWPLTSLVGP